MINISVPPYTSFILRAWNEEKWIGKVLEMLFRQSRTDFEIIVVDNGSRDNTLKIVRQYPIHKIIFIKPDEFNYSYTINAGAFHARGDIVGVLNGHSVPCTRTWYEDGVANFTDPYVAGISGYYTSLPDASKQEKEWDKTRGLLTQTKYIYSPWMTNTNSLVRKKLWREYPFDENLSMCEDYDWAKEMLARGYKVIREPKFNVYHSHGGLRRATFLDLVPHYKLAINKINKKNRPSKSYTRLFQPKKSPISICRTNIVLKYIQFWKKYKEQPPFTG